MKEEEETSEAKIELFKSSLKILPKPVGENMGTFVGQNMKIVSLSSVVISPWNNKPQPNSYWHKSILPPPPPPTPHTPHPTLSLLIFVWFSLVFHLFFLVFRISSANSLPCALILVFHVVWYKNGLCCKNELGLLCLWSVY